MLLSLVIPVYNEEEALPSLFAALRSTLEAIDCELEILYIDDGSRDKTRAILAAAAEFDPRVKVLGFSRNFGHQAAITAGLDFAAGDAVVVMDSDLQDPPELLAEMVALYRQGYDVVSAQRVGRDGESVFKRVTAALFYALMRRAVDERLQSQVGDFRLFSRAAVTAIRGLREQHRFMRGMVAWLGLREADHPVSPAAEGRRHHKIPGVEDGAVRLDGDLVVLGPTAETQPGGRSAHDGAGAGLFRLGDLRVDRAEDDRTRLELARLHSAPLLRGDADGTRPCRRLRGADLRRGQGTPAYVVSEAINLAPDVRPPERALRLIARPFAAISTQEELCSKVRPSNGPVR